MKNKGLLIAFVAMLVLSACSTTKYVGEDSYLLNKNRIVVENDEVMVEQLHDYISQQPNPNALFIPKLSLHVYSLSGRDTSKKINRLLRRMGSEPVIFDEGRMEYSEKQLTKRMHNLGYLNAQVTHCLDTAKKKMNVTYCIRPKERYFVRNFNVEFDSPDMKALLRTKKAKKAVKLKENEPFVSERFDQMSADLTAAFWNVGYYNLTKENFYFLADTSVGDHKVDVTLKYRRIMKDTSDVDQALQRYKFRKVTILNGVEQNVIQAKRAKKISSHVKLKMDTVEYEGLTIINGDEPLMRSSVLYNNIFIRPRRYYSDVLLENSYNSLNALSAVSQVGVQIEPAKDDSAMLDAVISLTPANIYYFRYGIEGTNNAGLGVSSNVSFQQRNLFKGSEVISLKLEGAYEHYQGNNYVIGDKSYEVAGGNYYEYGGELSLTIPRIILDFLPQRYRKQVGAATSFSFSSKWRKRPEYDRLFLGLDWKYNWVTNRRRVSHTFDLYNINYVVSRSVSDWFTTYLETNGNELLKESYKDQFITRSSYSIVYTSDVASSSVKKGWTIRTSLDIAGTLPFLICTIFPIEKKDGVYNILGSPFAQYGKVSFDVSKVFYVREKTNFVAHVGLGIAVPYANSSVVPFEQRFYAGGPNTVRGWRTRKLGPGKFDSRNDGNFISQTGDVKMVFNFEYRQKTNTFIDLAAFLDAGNVWTIGEYATQMGGQFSGNFYKELGFSWGVGIRPNFDFLLLRFDVGMQIYNPAYPESERWVITHPSWNDNFALHFSVGYPF